MKLPLKQVELGTLGPLTITPFRLLRRLAINAASGGRRAMLAGICSMVVVRWCWTALSPSPGVPIHRPNLP